MASYKAMILIVLLSVFSGWKANTYYTGYEMNLEKNVTASIKKEISDMQYQQAEQLTAKLSELKDQDFKVLRESQTIIERPIYSQQCIDQEGIELLKRYKEASNALRNKKP